MQASSAKSSLPLSAKAMAKHKLARLLQATGRDIVEFCSEILAALANADHDRQEAIAIANVVLPRHLLMAVLELLVPGHKFISVKSVRQLEKLTNIAVPENQRADLQKIIEVYPVRLSLHTIRQIRLSPAVAYQFLPFVQELDKTRIGTYLGGPISSGHY